MRNQRTFVLALAVAALIGCDSNGVGTVAGLGGTGNGNGGNGTAALTVLPTGVQISVGSTIQLSTNAGNSSALQWSSSANNVATVSGTGLVTGISVGTAAITVRLTTDTTNVAISSISVTQ
jgi:uncharacterized protein YjdB